MQGSFGFLPESRWDRFAVSRIWTAMTERGLRLVTWEGAMPLRLTGNPVTFQTEFLDGGDVIYRYNGIPTNEVAVGVFRNGSALPVEISPNTTSVLLSYIGDLADGAGETTLIFAMSESMEGLEYLRAPWRVRLKYPMTDTCASIMDSTESAYSGGTVLIVR